MTITTAFNRGDQVFFMSNNKIESAFVYSVVVHDTDTGMHAHYYLTQNKNGTITVVDRPYMESQLFANKDILRQSL